ncbi:hypothetical protein [Pseudorhodobacter aquimaris]|uniref:hypothetical protein n=1 Tax=Pseudorhodobacter aquimaris TaxID=687412 RepID=UPI00067D64F7|nr:hypothetical protein [Pseudorhodobacter aquimaris]
MDFDPTIDPWEVIEDAYFGVARDSSLRKYYRNSNGTFTAPLLISSGRQRGSTSRRSSQLRKSACGALTLVGEKEGQMARVVPHIFREDTLADRFDWAVIGFKKDATIDRIRQKQAVFSESLATWRKMHPHQAPWEALQS